MKKVLACILSTIMLAFGGVAGVAAAGQNFSDTDGNGICDNRFIAQSNGEAPDGGGRNYVDADGDAICDHRPDSFPCVGTSGGNPCGDQVQQRPHLGNRNTTEQGNGKFARSRTGVQMCRRMGG